jgi:hypothetical protein
MGNGLAAGTITATVAIASADVVCNSYGECWQTRERYAVTVYPTELGVQFYANDRKAKKPARRVPGSKYSPPAGSPSGQQAVSGTIRDAYRNSSLCKGQSRSCPRARGHRKKAGPEGQRGTSRSTLSGA